MKQKYGVAVALIGNTDFIVLDVPINGLDPQGIVEKRELILKVNHKHDITVLRQIRTCETVKYLRYYIELIIQPKIYRKNQKSTDCVFYFSTNVL